MGIIKVEHYPTELNDVANVFWGLSHPGRLRVIMLLLEQPLTLGQIRGQIGLSQSATSDQVGILVDRGWIYGLQSGNSVIYNANEQAIHLIKEAVDAFFTSLPGI
jgi:DNA-binding transcriptional ArsR family regulator